MGNVSTLEAGVRGQKIERNDSFVSTISTDLSNQVKIEATSIEDLDPTSLYIKLMNEKADELYLNKSKYDDDKKELREQYEFGQEEISQKYEKRDIKISNFYDP